MDKGFNDEELADIMNEIETLEQEFTEEVDTEAKAAPKPEHEQEGPEVTEPVAKEEAPVMEMAEEAPQEEEPVAQQEEPVAEPEEVVVQEDSPDLDEVQHENKVEVDTEMNEVAQELAEMPVEEVTGNHVQAHDDEVHHLKPVSTPQETKVANMKNNPSFGHSKMNFTVEGEMSLDMSFNVGGKVVELKVSEDSFEILLEGGMKFSIPMDANSNSKAA